MSPSPKVDSLSAWSRDVRPNAAGVTYSRRSYYYNREFSDSIIRPGDGSDAGRHLDFFTPVRNVALASGPRPRYRPATGPYEHPFTRGRVLESASAGSSALELQDRRPPARPVDVQVQASIDAPAADPEPGTALAGLSLDLRTIAQGVVIATDVLVRINQAYQRLREWEENGGGRGGGSGDDGSEDGDLPGLDLDPYHLEAGPPRRPRPTPGRALPARKTARRALGEGAATAVGGRDTAAGGRAHADGGADVTAAQRSLLAPLPAGKRVCYYLVATVVFGVVASFGFAVWWAQSQGDVSAGFTIGGYLVAVDALVVAVVGVVHRPGCRCWKA